jgi:hypothetical protein
MKFKTAFMLVLYTTPLILMLTGIVSTVWPVILMWVLMGMGMSGIGLSIMHDMSVIITRPLIHIPEKIYQPKIVLNQWVSMLMTQSQLKVVDVYPNITRKMAARV